MTTSVIIAPVTLDAVVASFVTFAITNAGFTAGASTVANKIPGTNVYVITRTRETITTFWGFEAVTGRGSLVSDASVRSRMFTSEPTSLSDFTETGVSTPGQGEFTQMTTYDIVTPYTNLRMFEDNDSVFIALELDTDMYTHMCFGNMSKVGGWAGGEFLQAIDVRFQSGEWLDFDSVSKANVFGSHNEDNTSEMGRNYLRFDQGSGDRLDFSPLGKSDGVSPFNMIGSMTPNDSTAVGVNLNAPEWPIYQNIMQFAQPSTFNQRAVLFPTYVGSYSTSGVSPLGFVPNLASVKVDLLPANSLVNIDWRVYPMSQRVGDNAIASISNGYGIAYREV